MQKMSRLRALALLGGLAMAGPLHAGFEVVLSPPDVLLTGMTPGSSASLVAMARHMDEEGISIVTPRQEILADADSDGQEDFALGGEAPLKSIWFGVEMTTGAAWATTPADFPLTEIEAGKVVLLTQGSSSSLQVGLLFAHLWLVRPGTGAWTVRAGDGADLDLQPAQEGQLEAAFSAFSPVASSPSPPASVAVGDWIVVIDPDEMTLYTGKVEAGTSVTSPLRLQPVSWQGVRP